MRSDRLHVRPPRRRFKLWFAWSWWPRACLWAREREIDFCRVLRPARRRGPGGLAAAKGHWLSSGASKVRRGGCRRHKGAAPSPTPSTTRSPPGALRASGPLSSATSTDTRKRVEKGAPAASIGADIFYYYYYYFEVSKCPPVCLVRSRSKWRPASGGRGGGGGRRPGCSMVRLPRPAITQLLAAVGAGSPFSTPSVCLSVRPPPCACSQDSGAVETGRCLLD